MHKLPIMVTQHLSNPVSAVFITFPGNCKKALTFYQTCFGGVLQFETFEKQLPGFDEFPVVTGSLVSDRISIYGSDLVHDEGRMPGNHMAVFLQCKNSDDREFLIEKLAADSPAVDYNARLIEITDGFDVRWVFGI